MTAWGFLTSQETGAPFSLALPAAEEGVLAGGNVNPDGTRTKYVSLNKVAVNIFGPKDTLFVVRDLSSMVNL
jgi:hypothetical protein